MRGSYRSGPSDFLPHRLVHERAEADVAGDVFVDPVEEVLVQPDRGGLLGRGGAFGATGLGGLLGFLRRHRKFLDRLTEYVNLLFGECGDSVIASHYATSDHRHLRC